RQRDIIDTKRKESPELSVRAARRLLADKSKARHRQAPSRQDKPKVPDWVEAYNEASDEDKAGGIPHIIIDLFTHMSVATRNELEQLVLGNAAAHAATKKQRNAIKSAQKPRPYLELTANPTHN